MDSDRELMERMKADDTGALEELILRSILFRAVAKTNTRRGFWFAALSFGIGHLVNIAYGRPVPDTLAQETLPELPADSAEAEYITRWERENRIGRLAELDEKDRRLLLGFSLEGKTTRELAAETGMTEGQVRVRLHRIRKRLRKGDDR